MKGKVLQRARAHFKAVGWSLVYDELMTKTLPVFVAFG